MTRIRSTFLAASVFAYAACIAPAQQPAVTQAVLAGKLVDVRTGEVRTHAYILIAGDRVQATADSVPAGVPITDLSAYTVLPGLMDAHGHILRSVSGPAHVPGFNAGRFGGGTKCVGCHTGHSAIPVAASAHEGKRFNASTSAEVTASSAAEGTAGARAVVDRRANGPADRVAWVARSAQGEYVRLTWRSPIEVDTLMLYAISPHFAEGTNLRVTECDLAFFLKGREVRRGVVRRELSSHGTRVDCGGIHVDAIAVRPTRMTGTIQHRTAVAIAEIVTLARLPEE